MGYVYIYMHIYMKVRYWRWVSFSIGLYLVSQGLPLNPDLADSAGLASQFALAIPSLPPDCWNYKVAAKPSKAFVGPGVLSYDPHVFMVKYFIC